MIFKRIYNPVWIVPLLFIAIGLDGALAQTGPDNLYEINKDDLFKTRKINQDPGQPGFRPSSEPQNLSELISRPLNEPQDKLLFFKTVWYLINGRPVGTEVPDSLLLVMVETTDILNVLRNELISKFDELNPDRQFEDILLKEMEEKSGTKSITKKDSKQKADDQSRFLRAFRTRLSEKSSAVSDSMILAVGERSNIIETFLQENVADHFRDRYIEVKGLDSLKYKNKKRISADQNINIFGWHPYWVGSAFRSYNFELLSIISYFSYDIDPSSGGYRNRDAIKDWKGTELVEMAHEKGCKVLLTVTNHGFINNEIFLSSKPIVHQNLIDSVLLLVEEKGADGININFENIPSRYSREYNLFVRNISEQFRGRNDSMMITLTLPAFDDGKVYNIPFLLQDVDLFVIMGYDFHKNNGNRPAAVSPLYSGPGKRDIAASVDSYLAAGMPKGNLLLGLPYYGGVWDVSGSKAEYIRDIAYRDIRTKYDGYKVYYDSLSHSNYYIIPNTSGLETRYTEIWFDDARSLRSKYDWIINKKIGGLGIWALGYDNGYNELWASIDEKFTEYNIPKTTIWPVIFVRSVRKHSNIIMVALCFLLVSMFFGFASSLGDWRVREVLFKTQTLRLFYIGFSFLVFLLILVFAGFVPPMVLMVVVGLIVGLFLTMLISGYVSRVYNKRP